jgi:IPT/TIG domain/Domain of unknown function DUF11
MSARRLFPALLVCVLATVRMFGAPDITSFSPTSGGPGTQVTINGNNLAPTIEVQFFGSSAATILQSTSTRLVAVVPPDAETGPIAVYASTGAGQSAAFFHVTPRISRFYTQLIGGAPVTPVIGTAGTTFTIEGYNFYDTTGLTTVYLGTTKTPATVVSDKVIQGTMPSGGQSGFLVVSNSAGMVSTASKIYYNPQIVSFPPKATPGASLSLTGVSFTDTSLVEIGAESVPIVSVTQTNLTITVPIDAVDGPITVAAPGGAFITATALKILPLITSISPAGGPGGTVITLSGGGFTGATAVAIGSVSASFSVVGPTTMTVTAPLAFVSGPITVTTPNGSASSPIPFSAPPKLSSIDVSSGTPGSTVTLGGSGLSGVTNVFLGVWPATYKIVSDSVVTAQVPLSALGAARWIVESPGGAATNSGSFTIVGPSPTITGFRPAYGGPGTSVTITGTHLDTTTSVTFNGAAANFGFTNGNLVAVVPTSAATGPISVSNAYGAAQSATAFVVGTTADLSIAATPLNNPAFAFSPLAVVLSLKNGGPVPASGLVVTVGLSTNFSLSSVDNVLNYDVLGTNVVLRPSDLAPGGFLTATLHLKVGGAGIAGLAVSAVSSVSDPNLGNNQASVSVSVVVPSLELDPVDSGTFSLLWPSPASAYALESSTAPVIGPWSMVTNTPSDDGVSRQLILPYAGGGGYYRLRLVSGP